MNYNVDPKRIDFHDALDDFLDEIEYGDTFKSYKEFDKLVDKLRRKIVEEELKCQQSSSSDS